MDLDSTSAEWLKSNLFTIEDDLTRALIWRCFYDGVRDGVLIKCTDFLDLANQLMKKETNAYILETITNFYTQILFNYSPSEVSAIYQSRGFEVIRDILETTEDKEIAKLVKGLICRLASKPEEIEILKQWKEGTYAPFDHKEKKPSID